MMYSDAGGEISRAFSADSPIFRQVLPNNIPSAVPPVSFIHGQNFGSSTQSFVGRMAGTHCKSTEWISDSAIAVRSAEGIVGFGSTVITIEQQIATLEHAFSSDVPILAHLNQSNSNLTVHGLNFGINDGTLQMRAGFSSAISTEWLSDTSVRCFCSLSARTSLVAKLTLGLRVASLTNSISFEVPSISVMEKVNAGVNALLELHIPGISFAPSMTSRVRVGATSCQATFWNSTAGVHCKVAPGNGPSVRLILTSGGSFVSSATVGFSFDQIAYPAVGGSNQPTFQGEFFLLVDRSQGLVQYSSQFRLSSQLASLHSGFQQPRCLPLLALQWEVALESALL